jgi:DNA-binding response OmpR family regulator
MQREKFQVLEAQDGVQALRLASKVGDALDLIVSDIQMPGGDGLTLARSVRESFPRLPIILISGQVESASQRSGISFEIVQKPFLPETLLAAIGNAKKMMTSRRTDTAAE